MLLNLNNPQKTSQSIVNLAKKIPFSTSTDIKSELSLCVSTSTIRRRFCEAILNGRSARKLPLMSAKNVKDQKKFAEDHRE